MWRSPSGRPKNRAPGARVRACDIDHPLAPWHCLRLDGKMTFLPVNFLSGIVFSRRPPYTSISINTQLEEALVFRFVSLQAVGFLATTLTLVLLLPVGADAQWSNRYPKVEGYSHHVYLEGYELPTLGTGVLDPAPSPDGRRVAFSSRGWLWVLDTVTGEARRITGGAQMDFRPAWSPDGTEITFVRDTGSETSLWVVQSDGVGEREMVNTRAIDLDPAFTADGRSLYYSSAEAGDLDLWRLDLGTGRRTRITEARGLELRPIPHPDGRRILYLSKGGGGGDQVKIRDLATGEERVLRAGGIASQARPALSPDGRTVALNWHTEDHWELLLIDLNEPEIMVRLTRGDGLPLTPAWSADGETVYYSESRPDGSFRLMEIPVVGGVESEVSISSWIWGEETGRLRIHTRIGGAEEPVPVRLNAADWRGHPAVPDRGQPRFDGQNGLVFFYSPGVIEIEVPVGEVSVTATRGFTMPSASTVTRVSAGQTQDVALDLEVIWDPREEGWYSGEHHLHLNYGGPYSLEPTHLIAQMEGEDLDVATPLVANLQNRMNDRKWAGWSHLGEEPLIHFGQEVRTRLGHIGLAGIQSLFWPWIWGPGNRVYGSVDRPNSDVLAHARRYNAVATYVHPVQSNRNPFLEGGTGGVPLELIADAVLGDLDAIEVACLWSNEMGTSELWYRILNLGIPLAPSAGTDVMTNLYHTMAVGTTRVYVRPRGPLTLQTYLDALREGRSFVTTGPLLNFQVETSGAPARPGDVVPGGDVAWTLDVHSPVPFEKLEILVNGEVVWEDAGLDEPGSRSYGGRIHLPDGGWIAVRARGGDVVWPSMNFMPFAHTAPIWIQEVGSHVSGVRRQAARELLPLLEAARASVEGGYQEGTSIPRLQSRFSEALERLDGWSRD